MGLPVELPRLALLAVWPMLVARGPGYAGFVDDRSTALPVFAIASLPMLLAWRGMRALHAAVMSAAA